MSGFTWDNEKRLANLRKHGIDFVDASTIFSGDTITVEDDRYDYGERRFITLGLMKGHLIAVVHSERGHTTRIISARKATTYEQIVYFQHFND